MIIVKGTPRSMNVEALLRVGIVGLVATVAISAAACGGASEGSSTGADSDEAGFKLSARELVPLLTRYGVGSGQVGIDITYAPKEFFEITGLGLPPEFDSRPTLAFMMQENVHEGELPPQPASAFLEVEGDRVPPYSAEVTADDPHHRTVRLLFPQPGGWSLPAGDAAGETTLRVVVPRSDGTASAGNTFEWRLPIDLGGAESEE